MFDLTAVGEMLIDFTPVGAPGRPDTYQANPGGAPANTASAFAALCGKSAFIGKVGADPFGDRCREALVKAGCSDRFLISAKGFATTLAFVTLSSEGERSFTFYRNHTTADVNLSPNDIPQAWCKSSRVFHFGSVSLTDEPSRSATLYAVKEAKAGGALISYDPNLRTALWPSPDEARCRILDALPLASLFKISEEEHAFLFGEEEEDETGKRLYCSLGIPLTVITKARKGCTAYLKGRRFDSSAFDVETVDTTGAGDGFWAAVLYRLTRRPSLLSGLGEAEFSGILDYANAVGSLITTKRGAIAAIPNEQEIRHCMEHTPRAGRQ